MYNKILEVCVCSNSRNDVPRVAQRYGTIAAHTRRFFFFFFFFLEVLILNLIVYISNYYKMVKYVKPHGIFFH